MSALNRYRLLENVSVDEREILISKEGSALILELSDEGVAHIWPASPAFRGFVHPEVEVKENQDLTGYLTDGDWAVALPWMYFTSMEEVMVLMNRNEIPVIFRELGSHPSIGAARAHLAVSRI